MEPHIMPLHSSSPPPLSDDDDDGEAGSEDDEFGDFGGFSVGVSCFTTAIADSSEPPTGLRQPSPVAETATHPFNCNFNQPSDQSQTTPTLRAGSSRGQMDMERQDCDAESSLNFTNGYREGDHNSCDASVVGNCSPKEEKGFADFTVFTEQAAHPWCCGFSPLTNTENQIGKVEGTNLGEQISDSGEEAIMDTEPRPLSVYKGKENVCTKVKHCEERDVTIEQRSQEHHQPQEAALGSEQPDYAEEDISMHVYSRREMRSCSKSSQTSVVQEDEESAKDRDESVSAVQSHSLHDSASSASVCDNFSLEGASADLEPNVSSLASQGTDWGQTDDEDEQPGNSSMADPSQTEAEKGFHHDHQSATQETSATSNQLHCLTCATDKSTDFSEHHRDHECVQTADVRMQSLGSLPPSDSFADFCSAPTWEEEVSWAEFPDQRAQEEEKTWTPVRDQVSSFQTDDSTEGEQDSVGQDGGLRRNSCQASFSCRVHQLLSASFPEVVVPAVEGDKEVVTLGARLHSQYLRESKEEEKMPELSGAQWVQQSLWWPHRDVHTAVGLKFQWGGSHTHKNLLRCLGVDTRNIVFTGMKKQPLAVPAFASNLGMLEPTKDSVPAVCSTGHTAVPVRGLPGPQDIPDPSTESLQEALPSRQLNWSTSGLSSSQDGTSPRRAPHFWGRK